MQSGQGIAKTTYTWPMLALAPRFGAAYDVTGKQAIVIRGGVGLFYDRPDGNSIFGQVTNPPSVRNVTVRNGQLQSLGTAQFSIEGAPSLTVFEYDGSLPSSTQWNVETQITLPWATSVSIGYVGQHSYNTLEQVNLNCDRSRIGVPAAESGPDAGARRLRPAPTRCTTPDRMRPFRGYGNINQQVESRLEDVPLGSARVQSPVPRRLLVRLQRHDHALRSLEHGRAIAAQRGRHDQRARRSGDGRRAPRARRSTRCTC